jgi:hypothetical protein
VFFLVVHFGRMVEPMLHIFSAFPVFAIPKDFASLLSFILLFIGVSLAAGFAFGRVKLVNIFINVYIALALTSVFPADFLSNSLYAKAILFFVMLVFLSAIDEHLFDLHIPNSSYDFFWRLFVMSALVLGMVVSVVVSLLPKKVVLGLPFPFLYEYFGSGVAATLWLFLPLLVLIFMNKRLR